MNLKQIIKNVDQRLKQVQHDNLVLMLIVSILFCELICVISIFIGKSAVNDLSLIWYGYLFKPALITPVRLFEGIWLILYILTGISLYLILNLENIDREAILNKLKKIGINPEPYKKEGNKKHALILLGIQFILNASLVPAFIGPESILGGLVISILMFVCTFLIMYKFYKVFAPAGLLVMPSVLWAAYLVGLNFTFYLFNHAPWVMWSFKHKLFYK